MLLASFVLRTLFKQLSFCRSTSKWEEAKLHGAYFSIHSCGGFSKVLKNTGLRIWMLELLYDKYCASFDISRVKLFYTFVWFKHYPYDALLPRY